MKSNLHFFSYNLLGGKMKVVKSLNKIIVYLYHYDKNTNITLIVTKVLNDLNKYYNVLFIDNYNLTLYINKYYGIILEIDEDNNNTYDDIIRVKLNVLNNSLFLYEVDDPLDYMDYEIYYYDNNFYVNVKKLDINLIENSTLIYGDSVYKIIGMGIKI